MTENGSGSLPFEPPEQENVRLREENARLRRLLAVHSIPIPQLPPENPPPTKTVEPAPPVEKEERARQRIALFRSLFRGREDVYARRWENADGRHGYMPAVVKDWKAINKSRPEDRKKVDQKTRKFLPLTDAVIEDHLLGKETVGVYPLLPDETCWFLAADFDKTTWEYDSLAFLETCQELNVPAALERSRSGKGGHIWIFFDRALPAITARKLGCVLLTRTMERRHQVGLDSYDRFFPNQDTMPKGGLGNLIALPLQFAPRKAGNTKFIDPDFHSYPDQWRGLCHLPASGRRSRSKGRCQRPSRLFARILFTWKGSATRHAESATPAGSLSEPGVLQGPGDAALDVRQATCNRVRPRISPAHRCTAWMSDRDLGSSRSAQDPARSSGRTVRGHDD
jgi:hypothetical protein